jgi:PAS domain S-box-containing protein
VERPLGDILENAPCGVVSFGDDGRIHYANATLLTRLGYTHELLTGKHFETLLGTGSRIFYQTHFYPLIRMHGRAQEVFLLLRARDNEDVGMLCNAARREIDGAYVIDCVFMEVKERRKFEEALLDARQIAERANAALQDRTKEAESAASLLERQALELELQHQQLHEQATELEAQSEELQSTNDELLELNQELEKQREAADDANHAKSNFLAVMSHELRTPLNAIGGYTQLLDMGVQGPVTDAQREALARIDRSQRHLLRLINDVLNLARIESGRVEYVIEPVQLSEVLQSVVPMVEPQMTRKQLQFKSTVAEGLAANADREKVQQILLNVLTNALKFTPSGGSISVEAGCASDSHCYFRVIDSGVGIPPEMLDKIFEPFIQVDASHSRPAEGTGLGLAISRDLARGMGGDLFAESEPGKGSTLQLNLPSASPMAADQGAPAR